MSLEADPENGLFYGVETLARKVAAFRICDSGIETVWKKTQTTTEWATLIGPKEHRVWVGTDIPLNQIPGVNANDRVVWRDASTGRLARCLRPGAGDDARLRGAAGLRRQHVLPGRDRHARQADARPGGWLGRRPAALASRAFADQAGLAPCISH